MKTGTDIFFFQKFEQLAAAVPNDTAIVFNGERWLYDKLNEEANRVANALLARYPDGKRMIALYLERSPLLIAAIIGVMKSGNAYIPLDTEHPKERIRLILEEADADLLLTHAALIPSLPADFGGRPNTVSVDSLRSGEAHVPGFRPEPEDPAYVLFTSGSTGRPKGVAVPHRALDNFLASMAAEPGASAGDRLLAVTTVTFDISALELFLPLSVGAVVALMDKAGARNPEEIAAALERENATIMQATPATWRMLIESGWNGKKDLKVLCGGEALSPELAAALLPRCGELWNMYGPTETTVWSTLARITEPEDITVGRPIANTVVRILDEELKEVPRGEIGEIHIGGAGLALGYLKRLDLTEKAFIEVDGRRIYKTGDLGKLKEDGRLDCLGRIDFQVKIRGFRIELGDIESAILKMPGVRAALAHAHDFGSGEKELISYVVPTRDDISHAALSAFLAERLPAYMVPACTVNLRTFPLNTNGKVDRKALPLPEAPIKKAPDRSAESAGVRETLRELWREVLFVSDFSDEDNFFLLGGNSILAVRTVGKINAALGTKLPLAAFFRNPTIAGLAKAIETGGETGGSGAVALSEHGEGAPLFCLGGIDLYRELAAAISGERPVYGVFVSYEQQLIEHIQNRREMRDWKYLTVEQLAAAYVEEIRRVQAKGPYRILGVSIAGLLAYEAAQQLSKGGERVECVYVLDTHLSSGLKKNPAVMLKEAAREGKRVVREWLLSAQSSVRSRELTPNDIERMRNAIQLSAEKLYDRTVKPYSGNVHLIKAEEPSYAKESYEAELGWDRLVRGRLVVAEVSGDHLGILKAPNAAATAEIIRRS